MSDEPAWTPAKRRMWRAQYAGIWVAVGSTLAAALLATGAWLFGLQSEAEARTQHVSIAADYKSADDAVKVWASDQDKLVQTRLDGISRRIDDQSALLTEIRDLVLRDRGRR